MSPQLEASLDHSRQVLQAELSASTAVRCPPTAVVHHPSDEEEAIRAPHSADVTLIHLRNSLEAERALREVVAAADNRRTAEKCTELDPASSAQQPSNSTLNATGRDDNTFGQHSSSETPHSDAISFP